MQDDKQLRDIRLKDVLEKRRLDQALNAKEFAVLAESLIRRASGFTSGFQFFAGSSFGRTSSSGARRKTG